MIKKDRSIDFSSFLSAPFEMVCFIRPGLVNISLVLSVEIGCSITLIAQLGQIRHNKEYCLFAQLKLSFYCPKRFYNSSSRNLMRYRPSCTRKSAMLSYHITTTTILIKKSIDSGSSATTSVGPRLLFLFFL